jgi:hypothetical protein
VAQAVAALREEGPTLFGDRTVRLPVSDTTSTAA